MLSDLDDEPRPKPIFKAKRKVAAKRRVRDVLSDEEDMNAIPEPARVSLFGVKNDVSPKQLRVARWARYSALGQNIEPEESIKGTVNTGSEPSLGIEGNDEYTVVALDLAPMVLENTAYTTYQPTNTFLLRESHFRDLPAEFIPLEKEYADGFGNVLDEEEKRHTGTIQLSENEEQDSIGHENMAPARDLGDMYDLEVSVDEEGSGSGSGLNKVLEIPDQAEILVQLSEKLAALNVNISLHEKKQASLKESLAQLQTQRNEVLEGL